MKMILHEPMLSYGLPKELVFGDTPKMNAEMFSEFCAANPELNIELDKFGQIHLMSPVNFKGANFEALVAGRLAIWNEETGLGYVTSSQGGFRLPNGAVRAPDAAWVLKDRADVLTERQWETFLPLCPDFIVEIRSKSDRISTLQEKMQEYIENGARLGFLIDPYAEQAWVYRVAGDVKEISDFSLSLSGDDVLPGFELPLAIFSR